MPAVRLNENSGFPHLQIATRKAHKLRIVTMMTSESTTVVIVGTGDSAHGLAHMYSLYGYTESPTEYQVFATEPVQPETGGMPRELHDTTVEIMDYSEAIKTADILLLCIPAFALEHFVTSRMHEMKERVILVDATNGKQDLESVLKDCELTYFDTWCKAFN